MKRTLMLAILVTIGIQTARAQSQDSTGIQFEKGTTWQQVLDKAKAQNKYIFVDCYATWCGPCRNMDKNVYPDEKAGAFFNKNFISVRVQMDISKSDDEQTKSWYGTARYLEKTYRIVGYPTFLFFNEKGKPIYQGLGYQDVTSLIKLGTQAIENSWPFYAMLDEYRMHRLNDTLVPYFISQARQVERPKFADTVAQAYLPRLFKQSMATILKKANLEVIAQYTKTPQDTGFIFFKAHEKQVDVVLGADQAKRMQMIVICRSVLTREKLDKTVTTPDWEKLEKAYQSKYGLPGKAAVLQTRLLKWDSIYYQDNDVKNKTIKDSIQFRNAFVNYCRARLGHLSVILDNNICWDIFTDFNDKAILDMAVDIMEPHKAENGGASMDTYANLLYKSGRNAEALEWERKAVTLKPDDKDIALTLEKMENGQKTWN